MRIRLLDPKCELFNSAAITSQGELFTWGRGNYGRLGHGTNDDSSVPQMVEVLKGEKSRIRVIRISVIQVMLCN